MGEEPILPRSTPPQVRDTRVSRRGRTAPTTSTMRTPLCGGGHALHWPRGLSAGVAIGGLDDDCGDLRRLWQAPVRVWTPGPADDLQPGPVRRHAGGPARLLPEDGQGTLYVYDAVAAGR